MGIESDHVLRLIYLLTSSLLHSVSVGIRESLSIMPIIITAYIIYIHHI